MSMNRWEGGDPYTFPMFFQWTSSIETHEKKRSCEKDTHPTPQIHESVGSRRRRVYTEKRTYHNHVELRIIMIYVLELENGKYYIGYSSRYKHRIQEHFDGNGSSWTRLYKPVKVVETLKGAKDTEREVTLRYMRVYGWENVRGAGYTAVEIRKPNLL